MGGRRAGGRQPSGHKRALRSESVEESQGVETSYDIALRQAAQSNMTAFDRSVVMLSSGTLALTVAFVGDVVDGSEAAWAPAALVGWLSLAGAALSSVLSHLVADVGFEAAETNDDPGIVRWNKWVKRMNWSSGLLLVAGQFSLALFGYVNL